MLVPGLALEATPRDDVLLRAEALKLAEDPVWLNLLHYHGVVESGTILSSEFYLSPNGKLDPAAELTATISAYFNPLEGNADQHPRCRFPARYFWLFQRVGLPDYRKPEEICPTLARWALLDKI
jgi:hypothetical protein